MHWGGGGGSESGVDLEGGADRSTIFLKQGVWGHTLRSYGIFNFVFSTTKSHMMQDFMQCF